MRSGEAIGRDLRNAAPAGRGLAGGTAVLARSGIAIWERVPRSGIVSHAVSSRSVASDCGASEEMEDGEPPPGLSSGQIRRKFAHCQGG